MHPKGSNHDCYNASENEEFLPEPFQSDEEYSFHGGARGLMGEKGAALIGTPAVDSGEFLFAPAPEVGSYKKGALD